MCIRAKFLFLFGFQLNCFACTAIYRFQLIFVRRKRKVPMVEYVPAIRNTIVTSSPVPIVRQTQQYQQQSLQQQHQQQHMVKVVSPKVVSATVVKNNVKTVPMRNTITYQQQSPPAQPAHRVVIAQAQPLKKDEDASRLRQMLEKRQQQKQSLSGSSATKRFAVASQKQQNIAQRIVHHAPAQPEIGSSEEDIETEVIDSSMVEVEMPSNSNSPLPGAAKQSNNKSKVVVQREPNVSVMEESKSPTPSSAVVTDPLKCDLCNKEFHSLRQRERHRVTHNTKDSTSGGARNKTLSLSEEPTSSPNSSSNKQSSSPSVATTKTSGSPAVGKRTGPALKRAKLSHTPDPMEDAVIEVTTAGEDSEN